MKDRRHRERGSAMLESALALSVFLMLLLGVMDLGQFLYLWHSVSFRVHTAVRYGSVNTFDATAIQNVVLYGQATVPPVNSAFQNMTPSMITVTRLGAGTEDDRIVVTVSNYPVTFLAPFWTANSVGLNVSATLPYEIP